MRIESKCFAQSTTWAAKPRAFDGPGQERSSSTTIVQAMWCMAAWEGGVVQAKGLISPIEDVCSVQGLRRASRATCLVRIHP